MSGAARFSARLRALAHRSVVFQAALLALASALLASPLLALSVWLRGATGAWALAVAWLLCMGGAFGSLLLARVVRVEQQAVAAIVLGMITRIAIPLCGGVALVVAFEPMARGGLLLLLIPIYIITLALEVGLFLLPLHASHGSGNRHIAKAS